MIIGQFKVNRIQEFLGIESLPDEFAILMRMLLAIPAPAQNA